MDRERHDEQEELGGVERHRQQHVDGWRWLGSGTHAHSLKLKQPNGCGKSVRFGGIHARPRRGSLLVVGVRSHAKEPAVDQQAGVAYSARICAAEPLSDARPSSRPASG
jgi:hypothetical protein